MTLSKAPPTLVFLFHHSCRWTGLSAPWPLLPDLGFCSLSASCSHSWTLNCAVVAGQCSSFLTSMSEFRSLKNAASPSSPLLSLHSTPFHSTLTILPGTYWSKKKNHHPQLCCAPLPSLLSSEYSHLAKPQPRFKSTSTRSTPAPRLPGMDENPATGLTSLPPLKSLPSLLKTQKSKFQGLRQPSSHPPAPVPLSSTLRVAWRTAHAPIQGKPPFSCIDAIPIHLPKDCPPIFTPVLTHVIKISLSGSIPINT